MQATIERLTGTALPEALGNIPGPPRALYVRGRLPEPVPVAIVGSRRPTPYGRRVAAVLAARLATAGVPIVSGLAFGIDAEAHRAALDAGGVCVAVLPGGLDARSISPRTNLPLAERIAGRGALVSEQPPGTGARKEYYPERNRLIAGLARAVVVVEGLERSGTLVTARHAAEQGRDVWAVPGPIESAVSAGPNRLIADGAIPLVSVDEFLEAVGVGSRDGDNPLLTALADGPRHLEELVVATRQPAADLEIALTRLELDGLVKRLEGGRFARL